MLVLIYKNNLDHLLNKNDETEIQYHNKHLHTPSA